MQNENEGPSDQNFEVQDNNKRALNQVWALLRGAQDGHTGHVLKKPQVLVNRQEPRDGDNNFKFVNHTTNKKSLKIFNKIILKNKFLR